MPPLVLLSDMGAVPTVVAEESKVLQFWWVKWSGRTILILVFFSFITGVAFIVRRRLGEEELWRMSRKSLLITTVY